MAFTGTHYFDDGTTLYRWDLTQEDSEQLARECKQLGLDATVEAKAESRRREILAERLLVNHIVRNANLQHNEDRAPVINELDGFLSIAHTRQELVIAINPHHAVGIDLETYRDRVLRVRDAFLNESERTWIDADDLMPHVVAWTAKEAIFKVIEQHRRVRSYRNDIILDPFTLPDGLPPAPGSPCPTLLHTASFAEGTGSTSFALTTILTPTSSFTLARTKKL